MALRELFLPLLGTWAGREELGETPWTRPGSARAAWEVKLAVGGLAVVQDYRQVRLDGSEFSGHGVFLARPEPGAVAWWFFDSTGQEPPAVPGVWSGAELRLTKQTVRGTAHHRLHVEDDVLRYEVTFTAPEETQATLLLVGAYRRTSTH